MTMREMQADVDAWIGQFQEGYFSPEVMMLRLSEEMGELAREVNHVYGPKKKKAGEPRGSLAEEMADVLFVLVSFANSLEIDLEREFQSVMAKFRSRDHDRWTPKQERLSDSADAQHQNRSAKEIHERNHE